MASHAHSQTSMMALLRLFVLFGLVLASLSAGKPVDRGQSINTNRPSAFLSRLVKAALHVRSSYAEETSLIEKETAGTSGNNAHIFFAGDDFAKLFVNGIQKAEINDWSLFGHVGLQLSDGDVVGLEVRDVGGWWGAIAQLNVNGKIIVTGRDDWLAIRKDASLATTGAEWATKSYSACSWERPVIRDIGCNLNRGKGMALNFPALSAAKYVWAPHASVGDTILLRYQIGDHSCKAEYDIFFAGDNYATLYVNGVVKGNLQSWKEYGTVSAITLRYGDIVALKVEDLGVWYGAIVAIVRKGSTVKYTTGNALQDWRATRAFTIIGDPNAWTLPQYDACTWDTPGPPAPNGATGFGHADQFPYIATGSSYVWAKNAQIEKTTVFLRIRIGGGC